MGTTRTKRIEIAGEPILTAAILICCAWGKIHWVWFWIAMSLEFICACVRKYELLESSKKGENQ